ncbi:hypothetical protein EL22_24200 [Halostagnicola sp. A56]|uniref:hypothetical protein n=1 Tax=Halostagnicola sp. A56 TaxID=1495067 RepID=UPI00049FE82E|nr:hypothetical protein [Halostagnicola sp. A56]KDE59181.1 hypothetical protein EL22_24200 [Halostagnicola sp. A56]
MFGVLVFGAFVLVGVAITIALWVGIDSETSDPTVVDRSEAERRAREQGSQRYGQASSNRTGGRPDDGGKRDEHDAESGWDRAEDDDPWGRSVDDSDSDDRWR